jgi:polysaccharide export outer membrane protein
MGTSRRQRHLSFLLVVLFAPVTFGAGGLAPPAVAESFEYQVGGRDLLQVTVYEEPDLTKTIRVTNEGSINFPLLGEVKVVSLTVSQIERRLEELLRDGYLKNPQVLVLVKEYRSQEVYVLGAVNKPGAYPLTGRATLLEMVSRAKGVILRKDFGRAGRTLILLRPTERKTNNSQNHREVETKTIDLHRLLVKGDLSLNLDVEDKDTIYIPKTDSVYVFGEVKRPGEIQMLGKDITAAEAIGMAGGLTRIASPRGVKIVRVIKGEEQTFKLNLNDIIKRGDKSKDLPLQAGDIIVVPESFF